MIPGSPEWLKIVTASKVAAILGVSPWESPLSMWLQMKGRVPHEDEPNEDQRRGHYLEPAILAWWLDQHPEVYKLEEHPTYTLGEWAAATPDAAAVPYGAPSKRKPLCLVEAKTENDMEEYGPPGTDVIPSYYLSQCYFGMHLARIPETRVAVLGRYLTFSEYVVRYDQEIGDELEAICRAFYDSLQADEPPPLDDHRATYEVLRAIHDGIDKGVKVELDRAVAREYILATLAEQEAEKRARAARIQVLGAMGRAQYADSTGVRVARRQAGKGGSIALHRVAKSPDQISTSEGETE